jgi:hypothetical protein
MSSPAAQVPDRSKKCLGGPVGLSDSCPPQDIVLGSLRPPCRGPSELQARGSVLQRPRSQASPRSVWTLQWASQTPVEPRRSIVVGSLRPPTSWSLHASGPGEGSQRPRSQAGHQSVWTVQWAFQTLPSPTRLTLSVWCRVVRKCRIWYPNDDATEFKQSWASEFKRS